MSSRGKSVVRRTLLEFSRRISERQDGARLKRQVFDFIRSRSSKSEQLRLLTFFDPGRVVSLMHFQSAIRKLEPFPLGEVAVISGSKSEPELSFVSPKSAVSQLSFEADPYLYDLSKDWGEGQWKFLHDRFDLVLMEQVLEHLIDPRLAITNSAKLLKSGGLLHISVPAINNRHGEPHYYFSGFSEELLKVWLDSAGFDLVDYCVWRSDKGARMYSTCDWAPLAMSGPLKFFVMGLWLSAARPLTVAKILLMRLRNLALYPFSALFSGWSRNSVTLSFFAKKRPGK